MIWPAYAPDILELPGGGLDQGESLWEANCREFKEETGFDVCFSETDVLQGFSQTVYFYAEDVDEYWVYHQTFFLVLLKDGVSPPFFEGEKPTPEQGIMKWISSSDIAKFPVHFMHKKAFEYFESFGVGLLGKSYI